MPQIVPAILETSKQDFLRTYAQVVKLPGVNRIQVDFGDGIFVPNTILPISEIDVLNPSFTWEAHLMLKEPQDFLDYQICGFKTIVIHYEAYKNAGDVHNAIVALKNMSFEPALCLKSQTPVSVLKDFASEVNHFQLMSVDPGFQGAQFLENTYQRIKELRSLVPNAIIEVDGGINLGNIKQVATAGADLLAAGSAITKAHNMQETWEKLQQELN